MPLVPARFLFRLAYPCLYRKAMPLAKGDRLLDLSADFRIEPFADLDARPIFAHVALAWNDGGIGVQLEVRGKEQPLVGDVSRPRGSDGMTLWLDLRDARTSHRASRYCHQFHFLATGGGDDREDPTVVQTKIHRALEDAPLASPTDIPMRRTHVRGGYVLEAFLPAHVLNGFDPEQHPRGGFYYSVRDEEKGEQLLGVGPEFPFWEDPTLWSTIEWVKG
jgi:hypothetical protein